MSRFLRRMVVLAGIILLVAVLLDAAFTHVFRRGLTMKSQWIGRMQNEQFDLAIAGSSRAYWNIDHNRINDRCAMRTISMANSGFSHSESLLLLKMFLANGNTVDRILLQIDHRNLSRKDPFSNNAYDFLPWLEDSMVYDHFRDRSHEWIALRYIPFARYGRYNFIWGSEEVAMTVTGKRNTIFDSTGSFFTDLKFRGSPGIEYSLTDLAPGEDLLEFMDLCCRSGIELELFMSPYYRLGMTLEMQQAFDSMLKEYDLVFHDFSDRLDSTIYFDDNLHVNREGGRLFTDMLIDEVICPDSEKSGYDICTRRSGHSSR